MSKRTVGWLAGALVCVVVLPLAAQTPSDSVSGPAVRARMRRIGVEQALRLRRELELSDAQVGRLEALRKEEVDRQAARMREMLELRSRVAAGDASRDELRGQMLARRDSLRARLAGGGDAVGDILTEAQRQKVATLRRDAMRRAMRARIGPRGPRLRGGRGFRRRVTPRRGRGLRPGGRLWWGWRR